MCIPVFRLEQAPDALRRLAAAGLTTREGCGNFVRNITACPKAGTCAGEAFDVTANKKQTDFQINERYVGRDVFDSSFEIELKNAKTELKRRKKLFDKKIITEAEYIQYETTFSSAQEEVEAAESNLQLIKKGTSRQSKETTNSLIRSTINGMVLDIPVEEGDSVIEANAFNAGTTIASVADMQEMIFKGRKNFSAPQEKFY